MQCVEFFLEKITEQALSGQSVSRREAASILATTGLSDIMLLLACTSRVRQHAFGDRIELCAIINAKSGRCTEDCAFCAQSARFATASAEYPLIEPDKITQAAARLVGTARRFSIVTSGRGIASNEELDLICEAVEAISNMQRPLPCASLGVLSTEQFGRLKDAGLARYHHNLEAAESYYPRVCTTHGFSVRADTVRRAQEAGLEVCSGGILGMGETPSQRIELAFALRELGVDSVALNFLNPIPGTPLAGQTPLSPLEILKAIAMFRFVLPKAELRICGGRELNLRSLQPMMYLAGASGAMTGNYLTTQGRDPGDDVREILALGLELKL